MSAPGSGTDPQLVKLGVASSPGPSRSATAPLAHILPRQLVITLVVLAAIGALALAPGGAATPPLQGQRSVLVVSFKHSASAAARAKALAAVGARLARRLPGLAAASVTVPAYARSAALSRLRADPAVASAAPERYLRPSLIPNDPGYTSIGWPYAQIGLANAWDATTGQSSVVIAVLDTGLDFSQPDRPQSLAPGYDFINNDADPADDLGHGTDVSGVLAAPLGNGIGAAGVCPGCTIMPVKVVSGATGLAPASAVDNGIVWATDHGADVINISLAFTTYDQLMQDAVSYATSRGVIVVAGAGNDGSTNPMYPASLSGVIGVAATEQDDTLASYSTHGSQLKLAAPGCFYTSKFGGSYGMACGTSIASPIVAGTAGLILSFNPSLTRTQVENALTSTADGALGLDVHYGRVDAFAALQAVGYLAPAVLNTVPPQINGTAQEWMELTASTGSWSGSPYGYSYAWQRCDAGGGSCVAIAGASAGYYTLPSAEVGHTIRVIVTATNGGSQASTISAARPRSSARGLLPPPPPSISRSRSRSQSRPRRSGQSAPTGRSSRRGPAPPRPPT
jgi:thermitase